MRHMPSPILPQPIFLIWQHPLAGRRTAQPHTLIHFFSSHQLSSKSSHVYGAQFEADKEAAATEAFARLIWDTALLESGFDIEAPKEFNARIYELLGRAHGIAPADLAMSEESAAAAAAEVRLAWLAGLSYPLLGSACRCQSRSHATIPGHLGCASCYVAVMISSMFFPLSLCRAQAHP